MYHDWKTIDFYDGNLPFFMQKWLSFASKLYHLYFVIKRVAVLIK